MLLWVGSGVINLNDGLNINNNWSGCRAEWEDRQGWVE